VNIHPELEAGLKWGSHLPSLAACLASSRGPVIELGVGHFSTPFLHAYCASFDLLDPAQQRICFHWTNLQPLFSEENQKKWSHYVST
jgi:hypothetical protein